jgi:hypothetical protein
MRDRIRLLALRAVALFVHELTVTPKGPHLPNATPARALLEAHEMGGFTGAGQLLEQLHLTHHGLIVLGVRAQCGDGESNLQSR